MKKNIKINLFLIALFISTVMFLFVNKLTTPRVLSASELLSNGFYMLQEPKPISDFELFTSGDKPFTKTDLFGKWTVMYFGFSRCPDECPTTMFELKKLFNVLDEKNYKLNDKQWVLVTIDPERDSPEDIDNYAKGFNKNFIGVRGERPMLLSLGTQLAINNMMPNHNDHSNKHLDNHVNNIILINPEANLYGYFRPPFDTSRLSLTYQSITSLN
jgi:protein SCO1/2